jgi:hypothetical protein
MIKKKEGKTCQNLSSLAKQSKNSFAFAYPNLLRIISPKLEVNLTFEKQKKNLQNGALQSSNLLTFMQTP